MNLRKELPLILLASIPFLYLAFIWDTLPEQVPLHWNADGEIDRYGSKSELWGVLAMTSGLTYFILLLVPQIDPKKRIGDMGSKYTRLRYGIIAVMSAIGAVIVYLVKQESSGNVVTLVLVLIGLLFAVLGNYMQTVRPNYFIGFRTPWTLESEEVWEQTHKMGGKLWFAGGLLTILIALLTSGKTQIFLVVGLVLAISLIPLAYSFMLYRRLEE